MFKLFAILGFLFAFSRAIHPYNPLASNYNHPFHVGVDTQSHFVNPALNNFGALSYHPFQHPLAGYSMNTPIFYGPSNFHNTLPANNGYAHTGAIGNPYAPLQPTSFNRQLKGNIFNTNNQLRQTLINQYKQPYNPIPQGVQPMFRMNHQVNTTPVAQQPVNNLSRTYMPIPTYMRSMPGYNLSNMPLAFKAGYQTLPNRPQRYLKQRKNHRHSRKLDLKIDKAKIMSPEEMTRALKQQIAGMRKLISSMDEKPHKNMSLSTLEDNELLSDGHEGKMNVDDKSHKHSELSFHANKKKNVFRDF